MSKVDHIRQVITTNLEGTELFALCLEIIDYVASQRPEHLRMLTYSSFARITKTSVSNPALVLAVNYLASPFTVAALEKHYMIFSAEEGDVGELISDEDAASALREGVLTLPDGKEVDDVESHLVAYFTPAADLANERLST